MESNKDPIKRIVKTQVTYLPAPIKEKVGIEKKHSKNKTMHVTSKNLQNLDFATSFVQI